MTVITMSRTELSRLRVMIDLADGRTRVEDAAALAAEKLAEVHGLPIGVETLRQWMQDVC